MAASASEEEVLGISGKSGEASADRLIDLKVSMKVASSIGRKWRWLGRVIGFEEDQLSNIEIDHKDKGIEETVYTMLKAWQRSVPEEATVKRLAEHLREVERTDLAHEILTTAEQSMSTGNIFKRLRISQPGRDVPDETGIWSDIKAALHLEHKQRLIPKIPWLEDWEMDFEHYYVELTIIDKNDVESQTPLHHHEIFKLKKDEANPPTRILIEGPAGYGKSTLACKLCYDHAKGKQYIRHFDAVILLLLRELEGTFEKMITSVLKLEDYTEEQVIKTIRQNQQKILLVLDGFDELHQDKHDSITPLLKGKRFPRATVIVTSRLGSIAQRHQNDQSLGSNLFCYMNSRLLIKGITAERTISFLQLYLQNYSLEKVSSLISQVEKRFDFFEGNNNNLFDCPLFLVLLVIVTDEVGIESIRNKTELYKTLFNFTLRRMFLKEGESDQSFDFFEFSETNPPHYVQMLSRFGSFAGEALKERKYYFSAEDVHHKCGKSSNILKLGILTQNESKIGHKRKTWYEPLHLSFLEFSFAYFIWASLMQAPSCLDIFHHKHVANDLLTMHQSAYVIPFLVGLCGKQLSALCSALQLNKDLWLRVFVEYPDKREVISESQLKEPELIEAFSPFVPSEYRVSVLDTMRPMRGLLKEIFMEAQMTNQHKRIIIVQELIIIAEDVVKLPFTAMPDSSFGKKPLEDWRKLATCQNLNISDLETSGCALAITICKANLSEQIRWLSNWVKIEGLCMKKLPIHKIYFQCPESEFSETLIQISQLISKEKVIQVKCENQISSCCFREFFESANQSKQLLDMYIRANSSEKSSVVFDKKEGKAWRKIELRGNISSYPRRNVYESVSELPSRIHSLRVSSSLVPLRVFVHCVGSPERQNLRELRMSFEHNCHDLRMLLIKGYLHSLQVLAIALPTDKTLKEQDVIDSILFVMSHCRLFVRLELWEGCTDQFIASLLESLSKEKRSANRNGWQGTNTKHYLDTLMLSPQISSKTEMPASTTVNLAKELLQSGVLHQLWICSTKDTEGYAKLEFIKLFSTEGFICKVEEKPIGDNALWGWSDWYDSFHSMFIFKITMQA